MRWKVAVLLAGSLFVCAPAVAADMDPVEADQIPEYVPSKVASGWYLRGDVTYNAGEQVHDFTLLGEETENIRFGGGVGVGYRFNDWLRADLTANYVGGDRYGLDNGAVSVSARHDIWSGLISAYGDLGTLAGFTPYVGAGVGVLHTSDDFSTSIPGFAADLDDSQTEAAFALNAGVGYRMADNLTLDVGYQFLSSPKTKYLDTDTLTIEDGVEQHQIKAGLRYEIQ